LNLPVKEIYDTIHPHPTLPESFLDALRDIYGQSIHLPASYKDDKSRV
jgi:hypothetical protein